MSALLVLLVMGPVALTGLAALTGWRPALPWLGVGTDAGVLVAGCWLATRSLHHAPASGLSGLLRVDSLSAFMVVVIGSISLLAATYGVRYLDGEMSRQRCSPRHAAAYCVLVQLFVGTMLLAVLAANIGVLWVAVEATTITTTFLVGHRRTRGSLEASWKYVVICSVGVAVAFLGTVVVYLAAVHAGGHSLNALTWTWLTAHASSLNPGVMRLAFSLLVFGYGAKVGLVPMHSWLPDAHSQAPAPVSALMSGVLIAVAFYALLRFKAIADVAIGTAYPRAMFVVVALLSLGLAAALLLTQRDYKRMLAYHSIEHMGLIALGTAAGGPLAIAGVLLHILGHGLAKGVLFLTSGEILLVEETSDMASISGLIARRPALGALFSFGLIALLGLPPFSLFTSELTMLRGELASGLGWAAAASLALMVVIFAAVATHARHLLLGEGAGRANSPAHAAGAGVVTGEATSASTPRSVTAPLVAGLMACVVFGVAAWPLADLLHAAAHVVAR
ncbi:MAG: proton-conducting transporter membrane subunit [Acidimicrobiales bacterium]